MLSHLGSLHASSDRSQAVAQLLGSKSNGTPIYANGGHNGMWTGSQV